MSTSIEDVCLCCLESENLLNIFDDYCCEDKSENYCAMLKEGFDIKLHKEQNASSMCLQCVMKLREAYYFRKKILDSLNLLLMQHGQTPKATFKLEYLEDEEIPAYLDNENKLTKNEPNPAHLQPRRPKGLVSCYVSSTKKCQDRLGKFNIKNRRSMLDKDSMEVKVQSGDIPILISNKLDTKSVKQYHTEKDLVSSECRVQFVTEKVIMDPDNPALVCEVCGKRYLTNKQLFRHLKTHETGPFACDKCDKTFTNINTVHAHKWRVHARRRPRARHAATQLYACLHCGNTYRDAGTRKKHIRYSHLKERPHKCGHCVKEFSKPHLLKSHMAHAHKIGEKRFQCDLCSKKFSYKSTLQYHTKSHNKKTVLPST